MTEYKCTGGSDGAAASVALMPSSTLSVSAFPHLARNVENVTASIKMSFGCLEFLDVCDAAALCFVPAASAQEITQTRFQSETSPAAENYSMFLFKYTVYRV